MEVDSHRGTEIANSVDELLELISQPDSRGGGEYWLANAGVKYPCLAMRFTGAHADVHWFGEERGTFYRCRRAADAPRLEGDYTTFASDISYQMTCDGSTAGNVGVPMVELVLRYGAGSRRVMKRV